MKYITLWYHLVLALLMLISCKPQSQGVKRLDFSGYDTLRYSSSFKKKGPVLYYNDEKYSGYLATYFQSGVIAELGIYHQGLLTDTSYVWYPDGQLKAKRLYAAGKREGLHQGWHPNGQLAFEYQYLNDEHEGEAREWYNNGRPYRIFHYARGKEQGRQQMWELSGKIKANYTVIDGRRYGYIGTKNCQSVEEEFEIVQ